MPPTTSSSARVRLGDLLVAHEVITPEQLQHALGIQRDGQQERLLGEILIDLDYATDDQVLAAVAEACGVPFARLTPVLVDPAVRSVLPESFIQKHGVLPLFKIRDTLTVAVSEPANVFLVDEIARVAGTNVQVAAATGDNIYEMLEQTRTDEAPRATQGEAEFAVTDELLQPEDYDSAYGNWPPVKVARLLLREAVRSGASAIHLEPEEKVLRVRFRIDGVLHVVMRPPMRVATGLTAALRELMGVDADEMPWGRPIDAPVRVQEHAVQLHMLSLHGAYGPRTVIRLVREDEAHRNLEKLGADFKLLDAYRHLVHATRGLVVVAGPREAGTTTTLYGTVLDLDPARLNVCTCEAAIAFPLSGVNQFSPATLGAPNPAAAVEAILAQRPDVLMLDGTADPGTGAMLARAVRDGCFVLMHVPAADAAEAMAGLRHLLPPDAVARHLRGVLAQRLVRTVCPDCQSSYEPSGRQKSRLVETFGGDGRFVKGRGCPACRRTGFRGRIGLFELVPNTGNVAAALSGGADEDMLRDALAHDGCPTLWQDGVNKVRAGITSPDEVIEVLAACPRPGQGGSDESEPAGWPR